MRGRAMGRAVRAAALALGLLAAVGGGTQAAAQGFEEYVLALSWSPTFCDTDAGRGAPLQCNEDADRTFIVHGLWPSSRRGSPSFCRGPQTVPPRTVEAMLDLMPSRGLIRHQWRKHGTCSGLSAADYFATVRDAYERVAMPPRLATLDAPLSVAPQVLRDAFVALNEGLTHEAIAVRCRGDSLVEVRICMTPDLDFAACGRRPRRCGAGLLSVQPPD